MRSRDARRFPRIALALPLVVSLFASTVAAQDTSGTACYDGSAGDLSRMAELARSWDFMRDRMLAEARVGDHRTRFGTLIDPSCLRGFSEERRAARITLIEQGLAGAIAQMRTCGPSLGIIEAPDVIAVLRRTRIICEPMAPGNQIASMPGIMPGCPGQAVDLTARATRRYEMHVASPQSDSAPVGESQSFEEMSPDDLSALFAHEAMHVLAMNNLSWHGSLAGHREYRECEGSVFYDRIYFTQAACFPNSTWGQDFYSDDGPYQCQEVCEGALTGIDEEVIERDRRLTARSLDAASGVYGPPDLARPYPAEEARRICRRIRERRGSFPLAQ